MTGRELIIYILENHLEDELVFDTNRVGGELLGFITAMEAAQKCNVGLATICTWYDLGMIKGFKIGETLFIPSTITNPMSEVTDHV